MCCITANGERYPGLFIHPNSGVDGHSKEGLFVSVSGGSSGGLMGDALELNTPYHVEVDFTQSSWTVVVNGETLRDAVSKSSHTVTQNMQCWSGFPNHDAADVTITALSMTSKSTSFPTTSPSPNPTTASPSTDPTASPSTDPTASPSSEPTASPSTAPYHAFVKRSCRAPAPYGNSLGDYGYHNGDPKSLAKCKALCAEQSECKSFAFSEAGQKCHLKDQVVTEGDDCQDPSSWNFETYYLLSTGDIWQTAIVQ